MTRRIRQECARIVPPLMTVETPASLLARFTGTPPESLMRMLVFLSPLTGCLITLNTGR